MCRPEIHWLGQTMKLLRLFFIVLSWGLSFAAKAVIWDQQKPKADTTLEEMPITQRHNRAATFLCGSEQLRPRSSWFADERELTHCLQRSIGSWFREEGDRVQSLHRSIALGVNLAVQRIHQVLETERKVHILAQESSLESVRVLLARALAGEELWGCTPWLDSENNYKLAATLLIGTKNQKGLELFYRLLVEGKVDFDRAGTEITHPMQREAVLHNLAFKIELSKRNQKATQSLWRVFLGA